MRNYKTEGIVLSRRDLGEADRILTLYTKNLGKIKAKAPGIRRTKSKLAGSLELFNSGLFYFAKGKTFDVITGCEVKNYHQKIKNSLKRTSFAYYIAELILKLTPERLKSPFVFDILLETLNNLDEEEKSDLELVVSFFELRLLSLLGYKPELVKCVHCRNELTPKENYFSFTLGGILCHNCRKEDKDSLFLPSEIIKITRFIYENNLDGIKRIKEIDRYLPGIRNLNNNFIQFILEKDLKSQSFIKSVENLER